MNVVERFICELVDWLFVVVAFYLFLLPMILEFFAPAYGGWEWPPQVTPWYRDPVKGMELLAVLYLSVGPLVRAYRNRVYT